MVDRALNTYLGSGDVDCVIQGGASGADKLARNWAHAHGVQVITYEYQHSKGKRGGPARNRAMMADNYKDSVCLAFPGGVGTASAKRFAKELGIPVIEQM